MTHHSPGTSGRLQWETDVPVLTHPLVLAGIVKTFGLAGAALWMLLSFMFLLQGDLALIPQTGLFVAALACGVMVLGGLAAALVYRNRVHVRFTIGQKGARSEMLDKRVRRVNRLAMLLGLLTGKAGAVGAGLIGEANATTNVAWASVASVRAYGDWYQRNAGNASALLGLRDVKMFDDATLADGYAGLMAQVGTRTQSAQFAAQVSEKIAAQLEGDRTAVSGVNLDEEAARLIQYQQAYQASAKMIQIAQNVFDSLISSMGR